jgi:hypothetical protein
VSDIHIDDFFKDAARTLTRLYLTFPRKAPVLVEEIAGPVTTDEFGVPGTRFLSCFGTLLWLAEEGYLRYEATIRMDAIDQAVLTGRCFSVLSTQAAADEPLDESLPASIAVEHATHIHRIRDALKSGSSARVRATMTDLMQRMVR